ncbi:hypothetical protein ACWD4G_02220 [Streptomyces sp. NPDC002643]
MGFDGPDTEGLTAELGAMRFPPSSTALQHPIDLVGLRTRPFPNPLAETTPSTVVNRRRPQGRVALRRDDRRPAAGLPRCRRRLEQVPRRRRRLLRHEPGHARARRPAHPGDLGAARRTTRQPDLLRLPLRLRGVQVLPPPRDLPPGRVRDGRLGHRLPPLHPRNPAGRPHRGRQPPPRHRRQPAAPLASPGARAGEDHPLVVRHLAGLPARERRAPPGRDPAAPHRREPDHRDGRRRRHPYVQGGRLHRPVLDAAVEDRLRRVALPHRPLDGHRTDPLHGVQQTVRPGATTV